MLQLLDKLMKVENLSPEAGLLVLAWPVLAELYVFLLVILTVREQVRVSVGAKRARNVVLIGTMAPLLVALAIRRSPTLPLLAILGRVLLH